jgi:hypothetical protein
MRGASFFWLHHRKRSRRTERGSVLAQHSACGQKYPEIPTFFESETHFRLSDVWGPDGFMSMRPTFFLFLCWFASAAIAQPTSAPDPRSGSIIGTVTDVQDALVLGATVVLDGGSATAQQKTATNQSGFFSFSTVQPGVSHHVTIRANGFSDWNSPDIQLTPGQSVDLGSIPLTISVVATTVTAALPVEIATEQVHLEEKQRALGFLPEFYAVYEPNPVPLTPRLKFSLAFRTATDPMTLLAAAFIAGIDHASDSPAYVEGAQGYGQRFGANYANGVTDTFIGGAILPTLLHQDPRYYYQGTGSKMSRILHAVRNPFVCKGDNGQWQPNYSSLGGYLASGAIANTYYPTRSRGPGLVFSETGLEISANIANSIVQEFLVHRGNRNR